MVMLNSLCEGFQSSKLKMQKARKGGERDGRGILCSWSVRMSCYLIALEHVGLNESSLMNNRQMHKSQTPSTQMMKCALMKTLASPTTAGVELICKTS